MTPTKKALAIDPKVGDELIVPAGPRRPEQRYIVVRVARIKFDVVRAEDHEKYLSGARTHVGTFRKDTAREDGTSSYNSPMLYTPEGLDELDRSIAATEYLRKLGIEVWLMNRDVLDTLTLANLIRAHLGEEEI